MQHAFLSGFLHKLLVTVTVCQVFVERVCCIQVHQRFQTWAQLTLARRGELVKRFPQLRTIRASHRHSLRLTWEQLQVATVLHQLHRHVLQLPVQAAAMVPVVQACQWRLQVRYAVGYNPTPHHFPCGKGMKRLMTGQCCLQPCNDVSATSVKLPCLHLVCVY